MPWMTVYFDEPERSYEVQYRWLPGFPGRGPSWSSPGEPPYPPEVDLLAVDPKPEHLFPCWAPPEAITAEYARIEQFVFDGHDVEDDGPDPDEAYERRRDDALAAWGEP